MSEDDVDVSLDQSVTSSHSLEVEGTDGITIDTKYKEKTKIKSTEDVSVKAEDGDIYGALIDVYQSIDVDQTTKIKIKVKEKHGEVFVKIKVSEKTKIDQDTDIDVLLTNEAVFDADITQIVNITQDSTTKIKAKDGVEIDLDVLLAQIADVDQDADVVVEGSVDDFTVSVYADQDADLSQHVSVDISAEDLMIA